MKTALAVGCLVLAASSLAHADDTFEKKAQGAIRVKALDDVMVLRVCAQLTQGHTRGPLPTQTDAALDRMANEADKILAFLGSSIYDKLKSYCSKLADQAVRGRTPAQLIEEQDLRKALYRALIAGGVSTVVDYAQRIMTMLRGAKP